MRERIIPLILDAVKELSATRVDPIPIEQGEALPLFGRNGQFDSLGLVTLLAGVEERLEDTFGVPVRLADDRALSQERSPFRTVGSLADFITILLAEARP